MGKLEGIIKSEIVRLARREMRKISVPLGKDVRLLKNVVSQVRKAVLALERFAARQKAELEKGKVILAATPEEVKASRLSPRLIRSLRKRLGITQKELAMLTGVTVGAVHQWESGLFLPRAEKKSALIALRKLGRREVKKLLGEKKAKLTEKKVSKTRGKRIRKVSKR
ncbi:MAG: helix-turn-helix domain-containing protein [Syntrophaceae bacterium]|nr:helix-turn-helix domain-containing protein [Syntrophaceae bacterium]